MKNIIGMLIKNETLITLCLSIIGSGYAVIDFLHGLVGKRFKVSAELIRYSNDIQQHTNSFMMYARIKLLNQSSRPLTILNMSILNQDKEEVLSAVTYSQALFKGHFDRIIMSTEYPIHISGKQGVPVLSPFIGKSDPTNNMHYIKISTDRGTKIFNLDTTSAKGVASVYLS